MQEEIDSFNNGQFFIPKSPEQIQAAEEFVSTVGELPLGGDEIDLLSAALIELVEAATVSGFNFGVKFTSEYIRAGGEVGEGPIITLH